MKELFFLLFIILTFRLSAQISVFSYQDSLPINLMRTQWCGVGVSIDNVYFNYSQSSITSSQIGTFKNGCEFSSFPFEEGLIIATGDIHVAEGPNDSDSAYCQSEGMTTQRDTTLKNITFNIASTSVLEFDFKTESPQISFEYVFASEEYPEYVCSGFNDVFAFFVTGPDPQNPEKKMTKNIALVPGTNLPVSINTINSGNIGLNCTYANHCTYCTDTNQSLAYSQYYQENYQGNPYIQYDGYTTALEAFMDVVPCQTYHLSLSIADVGDYKYQSALFLKKGGFSNGLVSIIPEYENHNEVVEGESGARLHIALSHSLPVDYKIKIEIGGNADEGSDYQNFSGTYILKSGDTILNIDVVPLLDSLIEQEETLIIKCYAEFCDELQFLDSCLIKIKDKHLDAVYDLKIPNVLTPNGDGINDVLIIENLDISLENKLLIYDRWGKRVYQKTNYNNDIKNGQLVNDEGFSGSCLASGTYYYIFMYYNDKHEIIYSKKGSLTIIR